MFLSGRFSVRRLITYGIFILCAYAAWARGGTYPQLLWPLPVVAFLLCLAPVLLTQEGRERFLRRLRRDPVFRLGLGFLAILLIQWINSNYPVVLTEDGGAELERNPFPLLPWSVDRADAFEMLLWFFPAWVCMTLMRNILHRKHIIMFLYLLVANGAVLAFVGMLQAAVGTRMVLGIWEQPYETFYASFGYANHACIWFYFHAFLAGGLAHYALIRKRPAIQWGLWSLIFILCLVSVFLSLSRIGALVALSLLAGALIIFLRHALAAFKGKSALNISLFTIIIALFGAALFFGAGSGSLAREIGAKSIVGEESLVNDFKSRMEPAGPAWSMARDYPLFGVGGWGYSWLIKAYVPYE